MLAPEFIVFSTLFVIPLVWTILKILINHLIDSGPEPPRVKVEAAEATDYLQKAA
jgi:hypothetical protein